MPVEVGACAGAVHSLDGFVVDTTAPQDAAGGLTLTFTRISYEAKKRGPPLRLLHDTSGYFLPSELTALMGRACSSIALAPAPTDIVLPLTASGAGKSTLLNALAQRPRRGGRICGGYVLLDGEAATAAFVRRHVGYVEQRDALLGSLTVRETLSYTAELKVGRGHEVDVAAALDALGLRSVASTRVASLSGGQTKARRRGGVLVRRERGECGHHAAPRLTPPRPAFPARVHRHRPCVRAVAAVPGACAR